MRRSVLTSQRWCSVLKTATTPRTSPAILSSSSSAIRVFSNERRADFGYRDVAAEEKERLVKSVFSSVASKYDIMNDLMSGGTHRLWKDEFVNMMGITAAAKIDNNYVPRHLDVAGGTGDIAFRAAKKIATSYRQQVTALPPNNNLTDIENKQIVICDINPEMLAVGRDRAITQVGKDNIKLLGFVEGNAEKLPFADESFDIYTIAFGLRNVTNKDVSNLPPPSPPSPP